VVEVAAFTAGLLAEDVERLATRDLGPLVTVLSSLRSAAEALLSAVTAAALERGEPETCCDGALSPRQWVTDWQGEGPARPGGSSPRPRRWAGCRRSGRPTSVG